MLESPAYPGTHTVVVTATDGLGNTTRKTLSVEVQPDAAKPSLEAGGALMQAPEGWVEQESYPFTATAKDAGYGVTSLALKIDGKPVAESGGACPEGGCETSISKSVNMAPYSGGAHEAQLVATDGAGNKTTKAWTINVDPEGHISAAEAIDTLEAADGTSESTVVAPTAEVLGQEEREAGDNPGFQRVGSEIVSTGVPDETTMSTNPSGGFTMHSPEGTATVTPVVSESSSEIQIAEGVAGVSADVGNEADSAVRPEFNGAQTFQEIRSSTSPEKYSWRVKLEGGETLRLANPQQAEVLFASGHLAYLITAEAASDATGATVPTSLEVSGNILTLKVEFHSGNYVYPIVAGQGWEGGYPVPYLIEGPEDELEEWEREQRELQEELSAIEAAAGSELDGPEPPPVLPEPPYSNRQEDALLLFGKLSDDVAPAPVPAGPQYPKGSHVTFLYRSKCGGECRWFKARVYNAAIVTGPENKWSEWENGTQVHADIVSGRISGNLPGWVPGNSYEVIFQGTTWNCGWFGPHYVHVNSGEHLSAYAHFTEEIWWVPPPDSGIVPAETNWAFQAWVYPNSFQAKHVKKNWNGEPIGGSCPTAINY
jgi:hypothetical protein